MSAFKKLALCATLLPAASCLAEDLGSEPEVAEHVQPLTYEFPPCLNTHWGDIKVTFEAGSFQRTPTPCALFDGDTQAFSVIAGDGITRTRIDLQFLQNGQPVKKTFTGFHTHVGGRDENPAGYRVEIHATCDEGALAFEYHGRANKAVALGLRNPCTTSAVSVRYWRDDILDDLEHVAELTPILYGAQPATAGGGETPVSGDHYKLLTDPLVNRCEASGIFKSASILSHATGAPVGTIELHRTRCYRHPSGTPVDAYFAMARNSAGLWTNQVGSVHLNVTIASGTFQNHKSKVIGPSLGTNMRSNVWVDDDPSVLSLVACGQSYPATTSTTDQVTSSGCTTPFALP